MGPSLLVLAAGMGSRYGGLKQIEPVGPSGETLLDYAVFDAIRAGFGRAVFVIRREFEDAFRATVTSRFAGRIPFECVYQTTINVPEGCAVPVGRATPLGTGHAVWCARDALEGSFAVINADDFYGAGSFARLAGFLDRAEGGRYALVGFRLADTLSDGGTVSRGVCRVQDRRLVSIAEEHGISAELVGPGRRFSGEEIVSMNCWGFTPDFIPGLESGLRAFLEARASDPTAEYYLPAAVSRLVAEGLATVDVLPAADAWFGITQRDDRPRAARAVDALIRHGVYPERLFG
jgi:NDP-sugar pyrophosphorylase family protein